MDGLEAHLAHQSDGFGDFFWHRLRCRAVSDYLPKNEPFTIVDVGAGAGYLGEFLDRRFPLARYAFVEPIPTLDERLEARYGVDNNARRWRDLSGARFVSLLDVVEHQENDAEFLAELLDAADPGATFLITVPALMSLWSEWDVALGHYRRYDRQTMRRLLERVPVDVLEVSFLFPELVLPGRLRAWRARHNRSTAPGVQPEFPELPRVVNRVLYHVGTPAVLARRHMPIGTSILAAARRRGQ